MSDVLKSLTVFLIAIVVVFGFIIFVGLIVSGKIEASEGLKGQVMGYTQAAVSVIIGFYFGSTRSSEDKNSTIATIADKIPSIPSTQTTTSTVTTSPVKPTT
jgi:hypothetical protein